MLGALAGESEGLTERELLRRLAWTRRDAKRLRGILRGLVRAGAVERASGRYRSARAPLPASGSGPRRATAPSRRGPAAPGLGGRLAAAVAVRDRVVLRPFLEEAPLPRHARPERRAAPGDVYRIVPAPRRGRARPEWIGRIGDPDVDFAAIERAFGLPGAFPPACEEQAARLPDLPPAADTARRLDLRDRPFVTIDPADARDHDDAVCVVREGRAFRLFVAIADVASRVPAGSPIDREARRRGNSIYLPDRAIPMLPERLTQDLCSLVPDADRAVLVVELAIAEDGAVSRRTLAPATIRSRLRASYAAVAASWRDGPSLPADPEVVDSLAALRALAETLLANRLGAGSLDLDVPEARVVLGPDGRPTGIRMPERTPAHRAIEEAMLAANRAVAELLEAARVPAIHRIHEPPEPDAFATLTPVLRGVGAWPERRDVGPADLQRVADALRDHPAAALLHGLLVRAFKQARYARAGPGHFALAFPHYLHFTSPIRRYADLTVGRAVHAMLTGGRVDAEGIDGLAEHLSERERAAMAAERRMMDCKRCALLLGREGDRVRGRVSAVGVYGLFVRLEGGLGDGLVPLRRLLPRHARIDERGQGLALGRERLRVGDEVEVRITDVDASRARVALDLTADMPAAPRGPRTSRPRRGHRAGRGRR